MAIDSIPARLLSRAQQSPDAPAYYVRSATGWAPTSWKSFVAEVRRAAKALMALGCEPGHTVCILGFNRPEWVILDHASMMAGGAPAGIYTTCSPVEVQYIVHHAESPVVLVENQAQWEKIKAQRQNLPLLRHVVLMRGAGAVDDPLVLGWEQFLNRGDGVPDADLDARVEALKSDQLATLIYTSGTTGPPKGVMLSHDNLAWTANLARDVILQSPSPDDCALSYLPLSHIAEQMFSVHIPATVGYSVYFCESLEKLPDNLKEVQPTVFFGVPRIWEKFHAGIAGKLALASGAKAALVRWVRGVCTQVSNLAMRGEQPGPLLALQHRLANKLVISKLKPAVGLGRAKICVSGAAPIGRDVLEFFASLDLVVLEVYGQSEDCGPTTINLPGQTRLGTVGRALPGVEVKIAADGEILVRGRNVFLGYYKEPEATAATLVDGWLCSGDLGALDADGYLTITGRKKEIIITAGGKNIAPKNIEEELKKHPLINEAVVIGDRRKFLSALVTLDPERGPAWAKDNGVAGPLHESPALRLELQRHVDAVNTLFAQVEHVRKFTVLERNLSIDAGELTPTLKVKRKKVAEVWSAVIEAMYQD